MRPAALGHDRQPTASAADASWLGRGGQRVELDALRRRGVPLEGWLLARSAGEDVCVREWRFRIPRDLV